MAAHNFKRSGKAKSKAPAYPTSKPAKSGYKKSLTTVYNSNITSKVSVFPDVYRFKGRFVANSGLNSATTQSVFGSQNQFNLNNIKFPQSGITNHAMLGWTELKNMYRKYKIHGVKINLTINNPTVDGLIVGIWLQAPDATNDITGKVVDQLAEKNDVILKYLNNSGSQVVKYSKYFPIYKLSQISKIAFLANVEDFTSLCTAAGPTKTPTIKIALANTANTSQEAVNYNMELTFYGTCYEKIMTSLSDPTA